MSHTTQPMPVLMTPRPGLCACGQPGSSAWAPLARAGVRTVVNLRPDTEMAQRDEAAEQAARGANLAAARVLRLRHREVGAEELERPVDEVDLHVATLGIAGAGVPEIASVAPIRRLSSVV